MIKGIIFDADGTLLEVENPYLSIAKGLHCDEIVTTWVNEYLSGKLDYQELVEKESGLFSKTYKQIYGSSPKTGDLERFFYPPKLREGAGELFTVLDKIGIKTYVLSTGFYYLVKDLYQLDILKGNIYSNRLVYDTEGEFMGIKTNIQGDKINGYIQIIEDAKLKDEEVAYVGDNAFDLKLIQYVLDKNGWVFLYKQAEKDFKIEDLPTYDRLILIEKLEDIISKIPENDAVDLV